MIADGVETVMGTVNDATFGPVVMFSLGGIHVEVLRDVVFRLAPFDEKAAEEMIRSIRSFALLDGARGRPRGHRHAGAVAGRAVAFCRSPSRRHRQHRHQSVHRATVGRRSLDALIVRRGTSKDH